jgi:hypothetical protein
MSITMELYRVGAAATDAGLLDWLKSAWLSGALVAAIAIAARRARRSRPS